MSISRRRVLTTTGAGVAALALDTGAAFAVTSTPTAAAATPASEASLISPTSVYLGVTSWDFTVQRSSYTVPGYQTLVVGQGEQHAVRTDLCAYAGHVTMPLVAFAHMTDLHIVDDQSTARVEFMDTYADPPHLNYPTDSSYRPHEYLSTQVVDAMCLAIGSLGKALRTRLPLKFTIVTGDAVDNCQHNENRWYIDLLDGGQNIVPDSGQIGIEQSVSGSGFGSAFADPHYYYPSVPGSQVPDNDYTGTARTSTWGFPYVPGLLSTTAAGTARRPYVSHGLGMPWYAAYGNHDGLWQGNLPIDSDAWNPKPWAVGGLKIIGTSYDLPNDYNDLGDLGLDKWMAAIGTYGAPAAADPGRRLLTRAAFIEDHFTTHGTPVGHGFTSPDDDRAYYTIPSPDNEFVQFITLDSTNTNTDGLGSGDAGGSIGTEQLNWLEDRLKANSRTYADPNGAVVTVPADSLVQDKMFVLFCHHTLDTMDNLDAGILGGVIGDRHTGDELKALIHRFPNVIAMVNGHTHANKIIPHPRPEDSPFGGSGFWEISTASHIDWPIQSRIIEIAVGAEGVGGEFGNTPTPATVSIFTTMIDPAAPLAHNGDLSNTSQLASLARELATNDPQEVRNDITRRMGGLGDRNTQLLIAAPFVIGAPRERGSQIAAARNADGRVELFGTDTDGSLFNTAEPVIGGVTPPWQQLDVKPWQCVAAGTGAADGKVELFTLDANGIVSRRAQTTANSSTYSAPTALDGTGFATVAAVNNGTGLTLFAAAAVDGGIVTRAENTDSSGGWGPWQPLPRAAAQLTAEQNSRGFPVLVGVNRNGAVFRSTALRANPRTASDFGLPVDLDGLLDRVSMTRTSDGRLALFGVTCDGQLLQRYETGLSTDTWSPWTQIPTQVGISPLRIRHVAAERNGSGFIELFIIDDHGVAYRSTQPPGGTLDWTAWTGMVGFSMQPTSDFSLALSSAAGTLGNGTSVTTQVTTSFANGFTEPVTLSVAGLPAGITATFLPSNSATPAWPSPVLRLTSATDAFGTFPLTVWGISASGEAARSAPYRLTIGAFNLWLSLQSDTVAQGNSTTTQLRVSGNGSLDPARLTVKGLPNGVTASFSPTTATADAPSVLTLSVAPKTAPGVYSLTVVAAAPNGQGSSTLPYQLNVVTGASSS